MTVSTGETAHTDAAARRSVLARSSGLWVPVSLVALTILTFAPVLSSDFVNWDDQLNFHENPNYRGLGWTQLRWMLTAGWTGHWIPVTWLTLGLDYVIWGMRPIGYHLTSLLFHSANAALMYFVARRLLHLAAPAQRGAALTVGAAAAALFFAVHPLRVESVAWVTERRDVVSGFFFLLMVLTYLRAVEGPRRRGRWLAASVGFHALALGAKAIVMPAPLLLLILDVFPLRRIGGGRGGWTSPAARAVYLEKVPYLVLSAATAIMALRALTLSGALVPLTHEPLSTRVGIVAYGLWFYVTKTIVPFNLSPMYELREGRSLLDPTFLLSAIAVAALTAVFWRLRRRWPAGLAAWAAYCIVLLTVSARVHSGYQLVADRYSYLACLGWALIAGGLCARLTAGTSIEIRRSIRRFALASVALVAVGLATLTWSQTHAWRDGETLWRHAVELDPLCAVCYNQLGVALGTQNFYEPAAAAFERGVALRPQNGGLNVNLADALIRAGRPAEAIDRLTPFVARYPTDNELRGRLVVALLNSGRVQEAREHVEQTLRSNPTSALALMLLGAGLVRLGRAEEAIPFLDRALALGEQPAYARFYLALAHRALGRPAAVAEHVAVLATLDPRLVSALDDEPSAVSPRTR